MSVGNWCERKLVQQAKEGDREAFDTLIRIHGGGILYYLQHKWGTTDFPESVDDLFQKTFIQAWKNKEMFQEKRSEGVSSFVKWLFGIAKHVLGESYRKRKRKLEEPPPGHNGPPEPPPIEEMELREADMIIRDCINKMTSPYREVMELCIIYDYTNAEMADMLERRQDTIRQQRHRGAKMLWELIGKDPRGQAYFKTIGK